MRSRRQKQQYVFAVILGAAGLINLLFFLILYRPARAEYFGLQNSIGAMQSELRTRQTTVKRLEKVSMQLGRSDQDRRALFTSHFVVRDAGFAQIMPILEGMTQRAGVRNSRKVYSIDPIPQYGLYSVKIKFEVQGGYPNIVNFLGELENSDTFFITSSIDVRSGADEQSGPGGLTLSLALETFFYQ